MLSNLPREYLLNCELKIHNLESGEIKSILYLLSIFSEWYDSDHIVIATIDIGTY